MTEEVYEKYIDRWDELPPRTVHTCATCYHNGCCEHHCGGLCWEPDTDGEEPDDTEGGEFI